MFGRFTGREQGRRLLDRRKIPLAIGIAALAALFVFSTSWWSQSVQRTIQSLGIVLIIACILGRTWCSFFIGGRKTYELIESGPYSVVRHPLYAFSVVGAAGVGAQSRTLSLAIVSAAYMAIVLLRRIMDEEREMLRIHGDSYRDYVARVPRLLPGAPPWRWPRKLIPRPRGVLRTLVDSCYLLLTVPLAEILLHLQRAGDVPVIFWLP